MFQPSSSAESVLDDVPPLTPVTPVNPAAGYLGGKRNLATRICAAIDATPHAAYLEPFVGMGGIFLRRRSRPQAEVINDLSGEIANFFRCLQEHYDYFFDMLRFRVASREEFERLKATDPSRMTDLQRAVRFIYVQKLAWGGKPHGGTFGTSRLNGARFNALKLKESLAKIHERLAGVVIEQLPWEKFVACYDGPGALFYLDPPYHGCEEDYGKGMFGPDDFARIAQAMRGARGKFIVSINATPMIRETFAEFHLEEVDTTYHVADGNNHRAKELIVRNFAPG